MRAAALLLLWGCSHGAPAENPAPKAAPAPVAVHTEITGCLTAAGDEAASAKFPAMRAPPTVTVVPGPHGIVVTHSLAHACCLAAQVTGEPGPGTVRVVERLTGTPCRCMCSSTLKSSVGVAPGTWAVTVDLEDGGRTRQVFAGPVDVP